MPNQLVKVAARANTVRRLAQLQQPPVKIALQENILQPQLQQVPLRVKAVQLENMVEHLVCLPPRNAHNVQQVPTKTKLEKPRAKIVERANTTMALVEFLIVNHVAPGNTII